MAPERIRFHATKALDPWPWKPIDATAEGAIIDALEDESRELQSAMTALLMLFFRHSPATNATIARTKPIIAD